MLKQGELHQISAEIGGLKKAMEMMTDLWRSQEQTAVAGRRALHEKFESLQTNVGLQISGLSLRVDRVVDGMKDMETTITKIEPAVKKYEEEKLREEGAKKFGAKLWAASTAIAGGVGWGLHELIGYLKH